ncbi:unnamed protein product [Cochlearia groenlandica]
MDSDSAFKLVPLITQAISLASSMDEESNLISIVTKMISLVNLADRESDFKLLINQLISLGVPMVSDTEPKFKLLIMQSLEFFIFSKMDPERLFTVLLFHLMGLVSAVEKESEPVSELMSLTCQIINIINAMKLNESGLGMEHLISLCPRIQVKFEQGKCIALEDVIEKADEECSPSKWSLYGFSHFRCKGCNGDSHVVHEKAPLEVKHPFHPKHFLHLVMLSNNEADRGCYCCGNKLRDIIYVCLTCNFAMNVACLEKPRVVYVDKPKWHEHRLALFPRQTSLTCNVCSLSHSGYAFYMCPPCKFVAHGKCLRLPRVIKITRHPHRVSFTRCFDQENLFCGVCHKNINKDCGGYSCIKDSCSYVAHSICATQRNAWDGTDLDEVPEEVEEEVFEPFMKISDGIIQHFTHEHHELSLDENIGREYDDGKVCEACFTPIFCGKFYSCKECDFILHEACAKLPRKMYHPAHAHQLSLKIPDNNRTQFLCFACSRVCNAFIYSCIRDKCEFTMHVECAVISEPLAHESHKHPLFLTSKPGDRRVCSVCKVLQFVVRFGRGKETFNCIECDDFALCFKCATQPHKVKYKYDKHMLTLSYEEVASNATFWCEICEKKIDPFCHRFYMCEESCCVTLHATCLVNEEFYMKPGPWYPGMGTKIDVVHNNHMSRPVCSLCKKRCPHKVFYNVRGEQICSTNCRPA